MRTLAFFPPTGVSALPQDHFAHLQNPQVPPVELWFVHLILSQLSTLHLYLLTYSLFISDRFSNLSRLL